MATYLLSVRKIENDDFTNEPGIPHYLVIPDESKEIETEHILHGTSTKTAAQIWIRQLLELNPKNIVIYIHGYNYSHDQMLLHLRKFNTDLIAHGFDGVVVGFDWSSAKELINYFEDRSDARTSAYNLFKDLAWLFANQQQNIHKPSLHLLAHSTGAFIVQRAFLLTRNAACTPEEANFKFSNIVFFAGDIALNSIENIPSEDYIFTHCERFINYYNIHDQALKSSNIIRLGLAPRAGQKGLANNMPDNCIDVNCQVHFDKIAINAPDKFLHPIDYAYFTHMWYFEDQVWLRHLASMLSGTVLPKKVFTLNYIY